MNLFCQCIVSLYFCLGYICFRMGSLCDILDITPQQYADYKKLAKAASGNAENRTFSDALHPFICGRMIVSNVTCYSVYVFQTLRSCSPPHLDGTRLRNAEYIHTESTVNSTYIPSCIEKSLLYIIDFFLLYAIMSLEEMI